MASLQEIGLAALIYNERWQEVRRELQWNPEIFQSFRMRHGNNDVDDTGGDNNNNHHQETIFHLLCSKGEKCPLDILESVLNIAPDLVQINSESLLQSLVQNQMWEIVMIVLRFYPDITRTSLFATRQGHLVTTLHLLCFRRAGGVCPPMHVVNGVIDAAPESLQWKGPGTPLHYAVHACCTEPIASERRKWIDLLHKLLQTYPEGMAVSTLEPQQQPAQPGLRQPCACTPLVLAVSLSAYPQIVQLLLESCSKKLLSKAGVRESYRIIVKDPTLYLNRDDDRKAVLDSLRPSYYLPTVAALCTVPIVVAAVAQPRYLRTSLGAMAVFNLSGGSKWILDRWERRRLVQPRGYVPAATLHRIDVPVLAMSSSPGLSLKFHDDESATLAQLPVASPTATSDENANNNDACVVCWDGTADHVLIPCGHLCLCLSCSSHVRTTLRNKCPVCNGSVQQALKIFGAGVAAS